MKINLEPLVGKTFGRLTILAIAGKNHYGKSLVSCQCECGTAALIMVTKLLRNETLSCGCLQKEQMRKRVEDLTGRRFGRLIALSFVDVIGSQGAVWLCRCDCGVEKAIRTASLKNGNTLSCGCFGREQIRSASVTHGLSRTHTYNVWSGMVQRCMNPKNRSYARYGGRGITVCERWLTFEHFLADMGVAPEGKEIERKNNDAGYTKDNCTWATRREQMANTSRTILLEIDGVKKSLSAWAEERGPSLTTVWRRVRRGETTDRLFRPANTP